MGRQNADFVQSTANFGPTIRLVSIVIWNDYFSANYIDIARDIVVFTAIFQICAIIFKFLIATLQYKTKSFRDNIFVHIHECLVCRQAVF